MIQSIGDLVLVLSILVALYYVPRYLWRVYGGPPIMPLFVNGFRFIASCLRPPLITDWTDGRTDGRSVPMDDLYCPRFELDRSKQAAIEVFLYNGWGTAEIRSILKGSNEGIGQEVEAARKRLGIEPTEQRTPIAGRPTSAQFPADLRYQPPPR